MTITQVKIPVTTDASGDATARSEHPVSGRILQMRYTPDATSPLDTGADIAVTLNESGVQVLTQSNIGTSAYTKAPRQQVHKAADGAAALYAAGGEPLLDFVYAAGERLKIVVAQGGNAKSGVFEFLVG